MVSPCSYSSIPRMLEAPFVTCGILTSPASEDLYEWTENKEEGHTPNLITNSARDQIRQKRIMLFVLRRRRASLNNYTPSLSLYKYSIFKTVINVNSETKEV